MPRPLIRILVPFVRCSAKICTNSPSMASTCRFGRLWLSAKPAAICFRLTAAVADVFSGAATFVFAAGLGFAGDAVFAGALPSFAGGADFFAALAFAVPAIRVLSDSPKHETTTRKQKQ